MIKLLRRSALLLCAALALPAVAADKPNILVIWGDDVGQSNISAYTMGMMGYRTPNIDRIAEEGMIFTDYYGEQSCTAGRSSFIMGQSVFRTGLSKVGLPGADLGMQEEDPTIAGILKAQGYDTGQFGKNHLGDNDEHLPTNHGFDEFFGNLYHLNAEEEPEGYYYPKDPEFREKYGPRGVIRSTADGEIEDTGPLNTKRMETVDEEFLAAGLDFLERTTAEGKPFFMWFNATRMHVWTHLKPESQGVTGVGLYPDGMVEHDGHVGQLLDKLDGRTVSLAGGERTLSTAGMVLVDREPGWRTQLLSVITDPNIAYLLMLIGFYGIFFELANPGSLVPGVIGATCLLLALFAFQVLSVNYAGLALIFLGLAFIIGEAFVPSFGVLGIGGLVAFIAGSVILMDGSNQAVSLPTVGGIAAIGAGFLLWAVTRLVAFRRRAPVVGSEQVTAERAVALDDFEPADSGYAGHVRMNGERWRATSDSPVAAGDAVAVTALEGLTVAVAPAGNTH